MFFASGAGFAFGCTADLPPEDALPTKVNAQQAVEPLRFTYDEQSARVNVHVGQSISLEGATVLTALKLGRIGSGDASDVDCSTLGSNTVSTGSKVTSSAAQTGERVFAGPSVEASFLKQFYENHNINNEPDGELATAIKTGTDSVIEGCVLRGKTVVARARISLFHAWDDATPDLVQKVRDIESGKSPAPEAPLMHDASTYGRLCEAELGAIPFFPKNADGSYGTYDCADGEGSKMVPVTVTDNSGKSTEPTSAVDKCDRPDWLRTSCAPYARVNSAINDQGTRWILLCRAPTHAQTKDTKVFNDIALIGSNPKTGKTCFVQNALFDKIDAAHIPSPADPKLANTMWASFNAGACVECHDSDAFIHSPWIDQVKDSQGHFLVPRLGDATDYAMNGTHPYSLVGAKSMGWTMHKQVVNDEVKVCTGCHRLADGATLRGESGMDIDQSWTSRSTGSDALYSGAVTPTFQAFAKSHTMPEPFPSTLTAATWAASPYGKAVTFLQTCSKNNSCKTAAIPSQ